MMEYVSLTTAAIKMGIRHFYSEKKDSFGNSMLNHLGDVTLLEIFTSGRYYRDIKFLKILVSKSKWFRVYVIFEK